VTSDPKRLTVVGATDLERTLLQAARRERPSPELTARMAAGLGLSAAVIATAAAPATAVAAAPAAAAVKTSLVGWLSAGVLAAAVVGGVVGVRLYGQAEHARAAQRPAAVAPAAVAADVPPSAEPPPATRPAFAKASERRIEKPRRHAALSTPAPAPAGDLRDQIALMDAARTAVKSGDTDRSLALLRRYDASYPTGAFRPEALALRIQALDDAGRTADARALAREFLARYPDSPLGDRVARVVRR
jgi:hypothetical protein